MKSDSRSSFVLIDPHNKKHILACHLEFEYTNNTFEYETLILNLNKENYLKVEALKVINGSEVVTRKVWDTINCVSPHDKRCQQEVGCLISHSKSINIIFVFRLTNAIVDALANETIKILPLKNGFSTEIVYKPSVPYNFTN